MQTGSRRGDLCVGVKLLNYLLSPLLDLAGLGVTTTVQVHAAEGVVFGEHETDAVVAALLVGRHSLGVTRPVSRVRAASSFPRERRVRHLGRLAVAFLVAPAYPLVEISHVLSVCHYCIRTLKMRRGHQEAPRLAGS